MALIEVKNVTKVYKLGEIRHEALKGIDLFIDHEEFVVIMGPSGSGKSTFMNIIGCLDKPTSGTYRLENINVESLERDKLAEIRNKKIGFVFQNFNLLARTSAFENVELPLLYDGIPRKDRLKRVSDALKLVGLDKWAHHYPSQLSGGQQQKVAIARALVNRPSIILADEPTGNLDTNSSIEIMEIFTRLNEQSHITIILVTHEADIADYGRRIIRFRDGMVVGDERKDEVHKKNK